MGVFLVSTMMDHPAHRDLRHMTLATDDAHELYARFGFEPLADPRKYMHRMDRAIYKRDR